MHNTYFITGFMGSGKTTIGQALGEKLGLHVIDIDQWIEEKEKKEIKDIFKEKGEDYFRELETEALQAVSEKNVIVTTGGGIVTRAVNREWMKKNGVIIYLHCEIEEVLSRLEGDKSRPNFRADREEMEKLFLSRKKFYEEAHITIDTTGKTVEEIVEQLTSRLKEVESGHTTS